jgi:hypothetical protein
LVSAYIQIYAELPNLPPIKSLEDVDLITEKLQKSGG